MVQTIMDIGLFVFGCLVLGGVGLGIIAACLEIYDHFTGADDRKQAEKNKKKEERE